ncbi:MAG: DUF3667 domain-containing protein [Emticicia sp.]|nr:DUF3667 domain-containing protein [Emticicia sp.]
MTNCKNCNSEVNENYCPKCGQAAQLKRIDGHYIVHEIEHILHFEKGIFYTIKELLLRPGRNVRAFLTDNRTRLVKPIIFIIVTSLIFTIITNYFNLEMGYIKFDDGGKKTSMFKAFAWVNSHLGYSNILIGGFIALWIKLFFRKYDYNFFEILILLCFLIGISMLIYAVFAALEGLTKLKIIQIGGFVGFTYCTWAIGQFFDRKKPISYLKAFACYILGYLTFVFAVAGVGALISVIVKQ